MSAQFKSTALIINENQFHGMKAGQWIKFDSGVRGQFMGITLAGVIAIRYQKDSKFGKTDAKANRHLRAYAKTYGSK